MEFETSGNRQTRVLEMGRSYRLGSDESNDFTLTANAIRPAHARFDVVEQGILAQRLDPEADLVVNGQPVAIQMLRPGDEVVMGEARVRIRGLAVPEGVDERTAPSEHFVRDEADEPLNRWLIAERLLRRLFHSDDVSLRASIQDLALDLQVQGVLLAKARDIERPEGIASFGRVSDQKELRELWPDFHRAFQRKGSPSYFRTSLPDGPPVTSVTAWGTRGELFGLSVYGDFEDSTDSELFLRTILSLLVTASQARKHRLPVRARTVSTLDFPPGICIGSSDAILRVYSQMELLANLDDPVLLVGETGVGKEHLAETLHRSSSRADRPFVAVNCAAIPTDLLEAEMFGVAKGAATGVNHRKGKFAEADGGTLFLDEIGEMNVSLQSKLLRALETGRFHTVGGEETKVDVRVISATNMSLRRLRNGVSFRRDLFYRVAAHVIEVPPLRDRRHDIPLLIDHFFGLSLKRGQSDIRGITLAAGERLMRHSWPGNVREFSHTLRHLMMCTRGRRLIDLDLVESMLGPSADLAEPAILEDASDWDLGTRVQELETRYISRALRATAGNQSKAADLLGIHRNTLAAKIDRLGIDPPSLEPPPF